MKTHPRLPLEDRRSYRDNGDHRNERLLHMEEYLRRVEAERNPELDLVHEVIERLMEVMLIKYPEEVLTNVDWSLLHLSPDFRPKTGSFFCTMSTMFRPLLVPEYGHQAHLDFLQLSVYRQDPRLRNPLETIEAYPLSSSHAEAYIERFGTMTNPILVVVLCFLKQMDKSRDWDLMSCNGAGNDLSILFKRGDVYVGLTLDMLPFTLDVAAYNFANEEIEEEEVVADES